MCICFFLMRKSLPAELVFQIEVVKQETELIGDQGEETVQFLCYRPQTQVGQDQNPSGLCVHHQGEADHALKVRDIVMLSKKRGF